MLRDVNLKMEYNSESDDVMQDFFAPCFSACTTFDRCVDHFPLDNLVSLVTKFGDFAAGNVKVRLIVGHKFGIRDVNTLSKIFMGTYRKGRKSDIMDRINSMVQQKDIMMRVAVPVSEEPGVVFDERLGIFGDSQGNMVAFNGSLISKYRDREFETVDVFTSWNAPERTARKRRNFQHLWEGKSTMLHICDFVDADKNGMLKYESEWAVHR